MARPAIWRDVAEGAAPGLVEAKQDAETVALTLG
jgi:hypothetical protein